MNAFNVGSKRILLDFFEDLKGKICVLLFFITLSLLLLLLIVYCAAPAQNVQCTIVHSLSNANLTLLGVDITALAILYALFQGKELQESAKKAFKIQNASFVGNAFLQLVAYLLSSVLMLFPITSMFNITLYFQILALMLVGDLIIELYTLHSAITNK